MPASGGFRTSRCLLKDRTSWRLPMLRQALQGRAAGRVGAGVAVRAEPALFKCGWSPLPQFI